MATITAAGYNGLFSLTCPGVGCSPTIVANRLGLILANSTDSSGDYTMNVGAAWYLSIPAVANPSNTVLDISSVYDGSGSPANNSSAPADVSYTLAQADPYVSHWSATRWLVWIANGVGLKVHGESLDATGTEANAAAIMTQAKGCGLYSLLWANDSDMNSGGSWATPAQVITAFNSAYSIPPPVTGTVIAPSGVNTATTGAAVLTSLAHTTATAYQLSDTTRDYEVYADCTTSGTAFTLAIGPTSIPATTLISATVATAGVLYRFRLPAGWYYEMTFTGAVFNVNAVSC